MKKSCSNIKYSPSKQARLQKRNKRYLQQVTQTNMDEDDKKIKVEVK